MAKIGINIKDGTIDNQNEIIVGIDLGTTNSLVAYTDDDGKPFVVTDKHHNHALTPSVLYFDPNNGIVVGEKAVAQLELSPERTIYSVKRLMGKSYEDIKTYQSQFGYRVIDNEESLVKIEVDNNFYTPIELSAEILKSLKSKVEKELQSTISKCVITVPAYFNDSQRQATRDAGRLAGMDVMRIINEPTAAALAYGVGLTAEENKTIAVYDLGGGTFDISILAIEDRVFEVLSTHGDTFLGGDDFDRAIIQHWTETNDINKIKLDEDKSFGQQIRLEAEKAKKHLSKNSVYQSSIKDINLELSLSTFNELVQGLIDKTLASCQRALEDANLTIEDIDDVILVGGSTRVNLVKSSVDSFFNKNANNSLNPDEVVALGAAIQASILSGKQKGMLLLDITPLSLGIETVGGLMDVIITRNSKVPNAMAREYTTSVDGQKNLKISVYQGERDLVEHNRKLGEFILSNIPPMPAGIPKIQVKFMLDADGILTVSAKELRSEVEQRIVIKSQYGISEEDMGRMLMDSIQNAESDLKKKALVDAINEAKSILVNGKRFLKQNEDWLSQEQVQNMEQLFKDLEQLNEQDDKNLIHSKMEEINTYTRPLAEEAMNQTIKKSLAGKSISED